MAIPAFVRYMRAAKAAEAYRNLEKIYRGAIVTFQTPKYYPDGSRAVCQFPNTDPTMIWSHTLGTCCSDGEIGMENAIAENPELLKPLPDKVLRKLLGRKGGRRRGATRE